MRTIIVCGGRDYADAAAVGRYLSRLSKPFRIIVGGCRGADALAREWAERNGVACVVVSADWATHGRAAGPIRNRRMLEDFAPCAVVAFPGGAGTRDMKRQARAAGVPVFEPSTQESPAPE